MKKLKRVIAMLLCCVCVFSLSAVARAETTQEARQAQIEALFDEMTEAKALSLLHGDENAVSTQSSTTNIEQIEEELLRLGVRRISGSELDTYLNKIGDGTVGLNVEKPANTNTTNWYLYSYTSNYYNSKRYDVQRLVAVGNNPGGMLTTGAKHHEFYSNKPIIPDEAINTLASIYVQKAIGTIRVVGWTPYELLFNHEEIRTYGYDSYSVAYQCVLSVAFTYVKETGQSEDYYELSFYSNKLSLAYTLYFGFVRNGKAYSHSVDKTNTIYADNYNNAVTPAIQSYLGLGNSYDYIYSFEIKALDDTYTAGKFYVPTPMAGPGQIW